MRRVFVDASAFATLAGVGRSESLRELEGSVEMPAVVQIEVASSPVGGVLERAVTGGARWIRTGSDPDAGDVEFAAEQLGRDESRKSFDGDVELLAAALGTDDRVVVTDDEPLRRTCKALGVPVSGSIGVLVAAVERGDLDPEEAKDALVAMDEVGARLSARLLRKAERMIDEAAEQLEE